MHNGKQVIASMTSYPPRIENVAVCVNYLLTKQTVKPDEVHIWLADPEFPERKIPDDLAAMIDDKVVFLHWLPENTYTHKKHEIFKIRKDFYCFLVDDDSRYDDSLIESTLKLSDEYPNTFINYTQYPTSICSYHTVRSSGISFQHGPAALYPPGCFGDEGLKHLTANVLSTWHDDVYYGILANKLKIQIVDAGRNVPYEFHNTDGALSKTLTKSLSDSIQIIKRELGVR